jgi:hypothetical protein
MRSFPYREISDELGTKATSYLIPNRCAAAKKRLPDAAASRPQIELNLTQHRHILGEGPILGAQTCRPNVELPAA